MGNNHNIQLPDEILGNAVVLKRVVVDHSEMIFKAIDQNREYLKKFLPWVNYVKTLEDEQKAVQGMQEKWEQGLEYNYAIFSDGAQYVGGISIHHVNLQSSNAEIGYLIYENAQGKGYVSRAVQAFQKVLFEAGFLRLEIRCAAQNYRSAMVPLKNGYRPEGLLRSHALENGARRDTLIFSLLKEDFEKGLPPSAMTFKTKRLEIRTPGISDAEAFADYFHRNRAFLTPTSPIRSESWYTKEFWEQRVVTYQMELVERKALNLGIWLPGGDLIGVVNFTGTSGFPLHSCFLGYGLDKEHEGKGLMTEALMNSIPRACGLLNLHRIQASYLLNNASSARVLQNLGFQIDGQTKQYLHINGQWQDHVQTSWVNPDWGPEWNRPPLKEA